MTWLYQCTCKRLRRLGDTCVATPSCLKSFKYPDAPRFISCNDCGAIDPMPTRNKLPPHWEKQPGMHPANYPGDLCPGCATNRKQQS